MVKILIFSLVMIGVVSCTSQKLVLMNNMSNHPTTKIRLDGYYVVYDNVGIKDKNRQFFLYENRIVSGGAYIRLDAFDKKSEEFYRYVTPLKDDRSHWGLFTINQDEIKLEKWEPSNGGGMKTVISSGVVLNDTTFILTERFNHYSHKIDAIQDTFRFHHYYPKPDSTNRFIK